MLRAEAAISTQLYRSTCWMVQRLSSVSWPVPAGSLPSTAPPVCTPIAARSGRAFGRGNGLRTAPSHGPQPSAPCRPSFWSAPERSVWMSRPGWVVHKRAFVTLGHNSLLSACSGVGHKGIAQYAPVGGRTMPESYGYVRISRPESPSCRAATRKPNASSCWLPAWRFLTSIRMSAAPVPAAGGAGTPWTPGWSRARPWLWCPSTASGGAGWTPWTTSTTCNGAE